MSQNKFLSFLIEESIRWVESQSDVHRLGARALSESERHEFNSFFESQTLNRARIKFVPMIENPEFYSKLQEKGASVPLDLNTMAGITYDDLILISRSKTRSRMNPLPLFFHELVHVVQYEVLGVQEFMRQYIHGWAANGFDYYSIPLERDAKELEKQYEAYPHVSFIVTDEVRRRLGC